jgi:small-conductance mechanosensitive channel
MIRVRWAITVVLVASLVGAATADSAAADGIAPSPAVEATATPAGVAWIRPEEVALRADGLSRALADTMPDAAARTAVERVDRDLGALASDLEVLLQRARAAAARSTPFIELDDLQRELANADGRLAKWEAELGIEAKRVAEALDEIAAAREVWRATRARSETAASGEAVMRRVDGSLATLDEAAAALQPWRVEILAVSGRVLDRRAEVARAAKRIAAAATTEWSSILVPGRAPLWRLGGLAAELPRVPAAVAAYTVSTWAYVVRDPRPMLAQIVAACVLTVLFRWLAARAGADPAGASPVHAGALAWLLTLLATPWFHPLSPQGFRQLAGLVGLVPAARILRGASGVVDAVELGGLLVLVLVDRMILALAPLPTAAQVTVLVAYAIAIALAWRVMRRHERSGRRWVANAARGAAAGLVVAAVAAIGGWDHLAALLGRGILAGAAMGVFLAAAAIGLRPLLVALLATPALRRSHLFTADAERRRRGVDYALTMLAILLWLVFVLRAVGMFGAATTFVRTVLTAGVSVGALSISIGTVLAFVLTLLAAMLFARTVTGVLEDDVYPRTSLPRGVPIVLSTLARYVVYALGFLLALAAGGIELGQLAILVGGLGVGIGLGLQDLVKNFAAGLTLLLERRVHPGDVVQIPSAGIFGRIRAIGMRATLVRAFDGSEVVVPNADMVASTITNWTLSDRLCRLEVPVGVPYGTDPERVLAVLLAAARGDARLLAEPPPEAVFKGFGASSLDFVVRGWTDQGVEVRASMTSDLGVALHHALATAGIGRTP